MTTEMELKTRYPGVKPFTTEDSPMFFGREQDIENLYSLIFVKQAVVLYGKSGYGKSSIFHAGITPKLKEEGSLELFNIRFNYFSDKNNSETISPSDTLRSNIKSLLPANSVSPLDIIIPNENSFWYYLKTLQHLTKQNKFILFFDQFEELFTYPKQQLEEFSELLSQLLYNKIPGQFRKKMMEMDSQNLLPENLHEFLYEELEIKVVFAIRSDRLSQMNSLTDRHPSILQNCYELGPLDSEEAKSAITKPALLPQSIGFSTPTFTYTQDALDKIISSITNIQNDVAAIETSTLQIICRYVEDDLVYELKNTEITSDLLGDITEIFRDYYENILNKLTPEEKVKIQKLIEDELIDAGRRNPLSVGYIFSKFGIEEEVLQRLEKSSLLRKERDASGRILYEVSHDSLVEAIEKVAHGRRVIEEEQKRKELESKIESERNRSEQLLELNKEISAKRRNANIWAVAMGIVGLLAIVAFIRANNSERKAIVEQCKADTAKMAADTANYNAYLASIEFYKIKFKDLRRDVQKLLSPQKSQDYSIVEERLKEADSIYINYLEHYITTGAYSINDDKALKNFFNHNKLIYKSTQLDTETKREFLENRSYFQKEHMRSRLSLNKFKSQLQTIKERLK